MDVFEAIEKRASVRSFRQAQITDKELEAILRAADRCPRIGSLDIIVLQNGEIIKLISDAAKRAMLDSGGWNRSRARTPGYHPLYGAPTVIMLCGNPGQPFLQTTVGIAAGMMLMAATALELGSVTVTSIRHGFSGADGPELKKRLGLSGGDEVILSLCIGYPDDAKAHEMKGAARNNVKILK